MTKTVTCELCGKQLQENVPFNHPQHVFNKPTPTGHRKACRECFNKR